MKNKRDVRRAAERLYAENNSVSVEYAMMVLRHEKTVFNRYRAKVLAGLQMEVQPGSDLSRFDNQELNLEILAEEAAEVSQIKSKIIRFGLDDYHPKNGMGNRQKLEEEIGHFQAMVDILQHHGVITAAGIAAGKAAKIASLPEWY